MGLHARAVGFRIVVLAKINESRNQSRQTSKQSFEDIGTLSQCERNTTLSTERGGYSVLRNLRERNPAVVI